MTDAQRLEMAKQLWGNLKTITSKMGIGDFREVKALSSPPDAVIKTFSMALRAIRQDKKTSGTWKEVQASMANPNNFLDSMKNFDYANAKSWSQKDLIKYAKAPENQAEVLYKKSAAAGITSHWLCTMGKFYEMAGD